LDEFEFDHGAKNFGNVVMVKLDALESMAVIVPVIWLGSSSTESGSERHRRRSPLMRPPRIAQGYRDNGYLNILTDQQI
jgi:hypothetical protein